MNVTAISPLAQRAQDFDALQKNIKTGNLQGAQTAFAAFLQDVQKTTQMAGPTSMFGPGTQAGKDLQALGGALKSANLAGAQKALVTLQQDIQNAGPSGNRSLTTQGRHSYTPTDIVNNGAQIVGAADHSTTVESILS